MDGPKGYFADRNKSARERQIPYDFTYSWNLNKNKNKGSNITKQKQSLRDKEHTGGCQRGRGLGGNE